ncbi:hypothetical protein Srubr_47490 [Streptomyces rubradiris]|uniref:Uncharacterized protein n=1 Tax=Streptomyces rubradiris TaxID=285531 RepID=A0ABQ3RGC0_STRRR|nr:hypothetical protein GCM10018792_54620 [Streptomyces rubradiris]GHI54903.1 hypothetical protein Srubr_47490 [Streptomyces rubradiris]
MRAVAAERWQCGRRRRPSPAFEYPRNGPGRTGAEPYSPELSEPRPLRYRIRPTGSGLRRPPPPQIPSCFTPVPVRTPASGSAPRNRRLSKLSAPPPHLRFRNLFDTLPRNTLSGT